jgi:syntaxin 1B/2/3
MNEQLVHTIKMREQLDSIEIKIYDNIHTTSLNILSKFKNDLLTYSKIKPNSELKKQNFDFMLKKYNLLITTTQQHKIKIKEKETKSIHNLIKCIEPDITDANLRNIKSSDEFIQTVILSSVSTTVENTHTEIASKYQGILVLEANVAELSEMFIDMSMIVNKNGELLDIVEKSILASSDLIEDGNVELVGAITLEKQIRRRQLCCCIFIMFLIGIIIGIIMIVYQLHKVN